MGLLDSFGFSDIELWRSEDMQLVQVRCMRVCQSYRVATGGVGGCCCWHTCSAALGLPAWIPPGERHSTMQLLPPDPGLCCCLIIMHACMQLMIPAESAHDTIGALGEVGLLQFKDLNADKSAFQRTYANQVSF
jgi:hypothetical protein